MSNQVSKNKTIVGFALGVAVSTCLGAKLYHKEEIGRFQISAGSNGEAYIIDTTTGQAWSKTDGYKQFIEPKARPEQERWLGTPAK